MSGTEAPTIKLAKDNVVSTNVSFEEYAGKYAAHFHEWVEGTVIQISPIHARHDILVRILAFLIETYFVYRPIGLIRQQPLVLKMPVINRGREPDIQVIRHDNPGQLTDTMMIGAADICIEVVSTGIVHIDHGDKFEEYEKAGVGEYWILDPLRNEPRFYRLNEEGIFIPQQVSPDGYYTTPTLPDFRLHVPMLWQHDLPNTVELVQLMQQMLGA